MLLSRASRLTAQRSPLVGASVLGEPEMNRSPGLPTGEQSPRRGCQTLRSREGALSRGDCQITWAERPGGQAAASELDHPDPLHTRGVRRGGREQHEHPAEGPAITRMRLLAPRRGAVCLGTGSGTLVHVDHPRMAIRVFGGPSDPHHKICRPRGPSRLVQGRSTGPLLFFDQCRRHPTPLMERRGRQGRPCRPGLDVRRFHLR